MKKTIVTTSWDDGHICDIKLTEMLKQFSVKGTLYVSPKDREFSSDLLLSENDVVSLSNDFEIGAHTITHPRLSTITSEEANNEIVQSKEYLEKLINKPVMSFCYPGGDYNTTNVLQVKKAGFTSARTVKRFAFNINKNNFEVPTTLHAYRHWSDIWSILVFVKFNPITFLNSYLNWDILGMKMFDRILKNGGVFHLWGHSWEIEENKDWKRLHNLLSYISNKEGVLYVTNAELYE